MKTVSCPFCKQKILVVPDMKAMEKAIESHASKHIPNKRSYLHNRVGSALAARVIQAIANEGEVENAPVP